MTKKRFENVIELNYVEDLQRALTVVAELSFNSLRKINSTSKISRTAGRTRLWVNQPFIGLRKDHDPVIGFRCRSESLADRLMLELNKIMVEKNPVVDEPMFTPQVTYHDVEPDWEVCYRALARNIIEAANNLHQLATLIEELTEKHPEFLDDDDENED